MLAALLMAAPVARASEHAITPAHEARARMYFQAGRARYTVGRYADALAQFEASYKQLPVPALLVNIAHCRRKLGRLDDAVQAYQQYLDSRSGDAHTRAEVFEALDEVMVARTFVNRNGTTGSRVETPAGKRAAMHFQWGRAHFASQDYDAALAQFEAAYLAFPASALLVNIGQCLRKLERLDEAGTAYKQYLAIRGGDPKLRTEVFEALDETLGELDRRLYTLAVSVAQFRTWLDAGQGNPQLRADVARTSREVLEHLVRVDDVLTMNIGVPPPERSSVAAAGRWRTFMRVALLDATGP